MKLKERVEALRHNTKALNEHNVILGQVNKVLKIWQAQDKVYHQRKEKSDDVIAKKLEEIIKVLKKK